MARQPISARSMCKIATIAHNRSFSAADFREWTKAPSSVLKRLVNRGLLRVTAGAHGKTGQKRYYPTGKGWKVIDRSCNLSHGRG